MHGYNGPPIGSRHRESNGHVIRLGHIIAFNSWLNLLIKQQILNIKNLPVYTTV